MKVKLAFYKATSGNWVDKAIAWYTNSKYSHVELVIANNWISSFTGEGVYINPVRQPFDTDKWVYVDLYLDVSDKQLDEFWDFAHNQVGKKYDYLGIFSSQFIKLGIHKKNKWFCSELVTALLQKLGDQRFTKLKPQNMSPEDIFQLLKVYFGY